ncbi:MAG: hypothetical protein IT481_10955 [Gammaproteobacteria bacterium]|nr:hypothetical protein [Gammaproteobacteria bacterium]
MSESTGHDTRNLTLLASIALAAVLALAATWIAALARVPQQRAAVERLLRAQTGLDVRYGRLVVRLGFYGPEAEFSNIEMHRPGADAPLLRAPRMVARFESWRLLRGGQLRPGRVLVSGAEIDLRQLSGLRRGRAAAVDAPVAPTAAPALLTTLETWLPSLLAGIPEGSLDFEAVTLVWIDPARPAEPLQLRAPRLYASRRVDGAQLSGTLLLPARFGRTLFVALQLRGEPRSGGGGARDGRLRLSGRGLVLASWRAFGLLPDALLGGTGDVALTVQLRGGRVQQAGGDLRIAGLGFVAPGPVVARRFAVGAAEFDFARTDADGLRWRLQQVELVPAGVAAVPFAGRGTLELEQRSHGGAGTLRLRRLPVEAAALLAAGAGRGAWPASAGLRITAGEVAELESSWTSAQAAGVTRGRLEGLALASTDGRWVAERFDAELAAEGGHWRLRLEGREAALRAPGLESLPQPLRAALDGEIELMAAPPGWSLAVRGLALQLADGPALRIAGSAGTDGAGMAASRFEIDLAAPLPRAAMALPQAALQPLLASSFWEAFTAGELATARLELVDGRPGAAELTLREVSFAGDDTRPTVDGIEAELRWDGRRLDGRLTGGQVGPLHLESGRLAWAGSDRGPARRATPGDAAAALEVEARLAGTLQEALRLARPGTIPDAVVAGIGGRARVLARLRTAPRAAARTLDYELEIEEGRWQPFAGAGPLTGLHGRVRADADGLRDGRLEGRWLEGPVLLRLTGGEHGELQVAASGRLGRAALEAQWPWIELVDQARRGPFEWSAELRREADAPPAPRGRGARVVLEPLDVADLPWRMRIAVADAGGAELRWVPQAERNGWRLDRGVVRLGEARALAGIPGALVVGGELERLDLAGLAGALARLGGSAGWQRPLVGEVAVAELALAGTAVGGARLRLAGSRESTAVDLQGEALAGELRQVHADPARLQARFVRLGLPADAPLASLADAFVPARTTLELQVAELRRGARSLGALTATIESDGAAVASGDLALRRGAQRFEASGRCERATLACSAEFTLAGADLVELQRDLGEVPRLRGDEAAARGRLAWSMRPGAGFAATLQGEVELTARLEGRIPVSPADEPDAAIAVADPQTAAASWSLLAPLVGTVARQRTLLAMRAQAAAAPPSPVVRTPRGAAPGANSRSVSGTQPRPGGGRERGPEAEAGLELESRPGPGSGITRGSEPEPEPVASEPMLAFESLELQLRFDDGVASIERYEAVGRDARLSLAGVFDFRQGTLAQQAEWYWIAPGVVGAVDRLDPRSPLAAGLRTLRELLAARGERSATDGGVRTGPVERFTLVGPLQQPQILPRTLPEEEQR